MIDGKTVNKCIFASSAYFRTSSGHGGKFVAAARTQGRASARAWVAQPAGQQGRDAVPGCD